MQELVRDIMTWNPATLDAATPIAMAARLMRDRDIGAIVVEEEGVPCGIVTDRDLVVRGLAQGVDPNASTLESVCSKDVVALAADERAEKAVALMRERGIRRLLVKEGGKPVGIVSLGDLARDRDRKSALGEISAKPANR